MIGGRTLLLLLALCSGLVMMLGIELNTAFWDDTPVNAPPASTPATPRARTPPSVLNQPDAWAAVALARPLFARDRRPVVAGRVAAVVSAPSALPRLAGVLIDGRSRRAIFAGTEGDKPVTVVEGGDVAGFKVQTIEVGQVTILGQDGPRILRPSFDARSSANPAAGRGPGIQALRSLTALPSTASNPPAGVPPNRPPGTSAPGTSAR